MVYTHLPYPENLLKTIFESSYAFVTFPADINETLASVLSTLSLREQEAIYLRHQRCMTLQEIAECPSFGLTQERVRQILHKAYRKLRHPTRAKLLATGLAEQARLNEIERQEREKKATLMACCRTREEAFRAIPLCDFELSLRSYNCLTRAGLLTAGDVLDVGKENLTKIRNLGKLSIEEVTRKIFDAVKAVDAMSLIRGMQAEQFASFLFNFVNTATKHELSEEDILVWLKSEANEDNPLLWGVELQ